MILNYPMESGVESIRTIRVGPFEPQQQSWWLLPGQELPTELHHTTEAQWDGKMQELETRFPPRTPLEDTLAYWSRSL